MDKNSLCADCIDDGSNCEHCQVYWDYIKRDEKPFVHPGKTMPSDGAMIRELYK